MRFINMTNNESLSDAIQKAEKLLHWESDMILEIMKKDDFKYNSGEGLIVATDILVNDKIVPVKLYRPWNRFTRAIAMTNGDGAIHFNIYKIDKTDLASKVGTILHEYSHLCGFKHGNNYKTKEKCEKSVPYFLSSNVEKWL
jgi:hypothetical protein